MPLYGVAVNMSCLFGFVGVACMGFIVITYLWKEVYPQCAIFMICINQYNLTIIFLQKKYNSTVQRNNPHLKNSFLFRQIMLPIWFAYIWNLFSFSENIVFPKNFFFFKIGSIKRVLKQLRRLWFLILCDLVDLNVWPLKMWGSILFLKLQPCHFSVMVFCSSSAIYLGFYQC